MKLILTESQYDEIKNKIYDRFIDMLVNGTDISLVKKIPGGDEYLYKAHIKYPFHNGRYNILFNNENMYTFTMAARYNMSGMFKLIGLDMDNRDNFSITETIVNEYLDRLREKIKDYIKDFLNKNK